MKLRTRLFLLLAISVLAILMVGLSGYIGIRTTTQSINEIGNVRLPSIVGLETINEGQAGIMSANLSTAIYENDYKAQTRFSEIKAKRKEVWARIDKGWKLYEPLPQTVEEARLWKQFVDEWKAWQAADQKIDDIIGSLSKSQTEEQQKQLFADFFRQIAANQPLFTAAESTLDKIIELNENIAAESASAGIAGAGRASIFMLGIGCVSIAAMLALGLFMIRTILSQIGGEPGYAATVAERIAAGDLTVEVQLKHGDQSSMLCAMKKMRDDLARIVAEVRNGTESIASASSQIASGTQDLSTRTEEQASSLEETASSMEELTSTVRQNADNANQANALAHTASDTAGKGGVVVSEVVKTMGEINESAKKIVDIIGVIDGIAFQTNILALNAAVEAARAGEQGRGFAVVAAEVRTLAQRSASAAKEIKLLIDDSVEKVESGSRLVDQAGSTMEDVVTSVKRVTDVIAEITSASTEQTVGIEQINQAIAQMDQVTQQNASLVEEAAAASDAMQQQARKLSDLVSMFKLEGAYAQGDYRGKASSVNASTTSALAHPGGLQATGELRSLHEKAKPAVRNSRLTLLRTE